MGEERTPPGESVADQPIPDEVEEDDELLGGRAKPAIVVIIVLLLAAYFVATGEDPFGLFEPDPPLPANAASGIWWQTMFTEPAGSHPAGGYGADDLAGTIPEQLIFRIDGAQESIDIAAFEFDLLPVAEALIAASKKGVNVRWITDDEYGMEADAEGARLFPRLRNAGASVRDDDREALMHNKFIIIDGQTVWTGSTNLTENGNFRNNNNVLVMEWPEVAAVYQREFEELWRGESGPRSPSTVEEQSLVVEGTSLQVLFAAEDEVMAHLIPLVESAEESIHFLAFSLTHDELGAALLDQFEAGLDVRGVIETRGSETAYSELSRLACAGVPVRLDGNRRTMHHKVLVIDGKIVVTGSYNFSENADDSNDENLVILNEAAIARQYLREFDRLWAVGSPPDRAELNCK